MTRQTMYEKLFSEVSPIFKEAGEILQSVELSVKKLDGTIKKYEQQIQELEPMLKNIRGDVGDLLASGADSTRAIDAVSGAEKKFDETNKLKETLEQKAQEQRDRLVDLQGEMQNKLIVFVEQTETYKDFQKQLEKKIDEIRDIGREWHHAEKMLLESYGVPLPGGRKVKINDEELKEFGRRYLVNLFD